MKLANTGLSTVMTVGGLIPADDLGITLPHEHLIVQGWDHQETNYINSVSMELAKYVECGGKTIVDVSSIGKPRDPEFYQKLEARSGLHIVLGTGFYKSAWLPTKIHGLDVNDLSQIMIQEIKNGVNGTGVKAGVIGEIGVSYPMEPIEGRVLSAAAEAQRLTDTAISIHFEIGIPESAYHRALDILAKEGANLNRVAVSHLVSRPDNLHLIMGLAERGVFVEFDLFGHEHRPLMGELIRTHPDVQISSIRGFIDLGILSQILLSQNVSHVELMTVNGGCGYAYIYTQVLPRLQSYGVSVEQIASMMVDNPRRWLGS